MVEFVNREDNERWHNNVEWLRKCRQRLHDKYANNKGYLKDCELTGWDRSQGLPVEDWGLATDEQINDLAFKMAGWGIITRKVFKLQYLCKSKASKIIRGIEREERFAPQGRPSKAVYEEFAPTQHGDY